MTTQLKLKIVIRPGKGDSLGADMTRRVATFHRQINQARVDAAKLATDVSIGYIPHTRPYAPPRKKRDQERIKNVLQWRPVGTGDLEAGVGLNLKQLNTRSKHWIIQEIGTGKRATVKVGGSPRAKGRPVTGATYVRTVRKQKGRRISNALVFASGPGGKFSAPGQATGQQLYLRSQIQKVPFTNTRSQPGIIIDKEIEGKHFVRLGGEAGFREYRRSVYAAARQQFRRNR